MNSIPTIRVKSTHQSQGDFVVKNATDFRYGETLFIADELEKMGEHQVRIKIESLPTSNPFINDAKLWLELKAQDKEASRTSARDAREEETLEIARSANRIASETLARTSRSSIIDRRIAITAIIIAVISASPQIWSIIKFIITSIQKS